MLKAGYEFTLRPTAEAFLNWTDSGNSKYQRLDARNQVALEAALTFGPFVGKYGKAGIAALRARGGNNADELFDVFNGPKNIPGRVQSRINLSKETIVQSSNGKDLKRGMEYAWKRHGGVEKSNKSQFSINRSELENILQSKQVVNSPVRPSSISGEYIREVDVNHIVGNYPQNLGGDSTSVITVVTDKYGNVVNTFPGIENPF
jgi:hypothetical protein